MKPAQVNHLTAEQYFLTRQTANLMEDFVREIDDGSSLFLLYGDESVGKSCLLRELTSKRFNQVNYYWFDFKANDAKSGSKDAGSNTRKAGNPGDISKLMEKARQGELIIVDHFELASNKARHELFQSWLTDGIDKKLNLIIATSSDSFSEVRLLVQQNHLEVKSFQLLPSSRQEIEAFVSFYLFPDNPLRPLSFNPEVLRQIKNCHGVIGKVARVAAQQPNLITQRQGSNPRPKNQFVVNAVLGLVIISVVAYWLLKPVAKEDLVDDLQAEMTGSASPVNEPAGAIATEISEPSSSNQTSELIAPDPVIPEPAQEEVSIEQPEANNTNSAQGIPVATKVEVEKAKQLDAVTLVQEFEALLLESTNNYSDRFQQDLRDTLNWITQIDKGRATIQIMLFGFSEFADDNYYNFLEKMKKQGVDLSLFKIYPARIKGRVMYGVIYGDYDNRSQARNQIQQLPKALKKNQPIPRTMSGIWNNISDG